MSVFKVVLVWIFASTSVIATAYSEEVPVYKAALFTKSTLRYASQIREYQSAWNEAVVDLPWERDFQRHFDDLVPSDGIVLRLNQSESCSQHVSGEVKSDCGNENVVLFTLPSVGDAFSFLTDRLKIAGVIYKGDRFGPWRSGCFGFPIEGSIGLLERSHNRVIADVDVNFSLKNQFRFPESCGFSKIVGRFIFEVTHDKT